MREMRNAYKIVVEEPEGKEHMKDERRWEESVKMDLTETGY
jgi:hypothetical protein